MSRIGAARRRSEREPAPSEEEGVAGRALDTAAGPVAVGGMEAGQGAHLATAVDAGGVVLEAPGRIVADGIGAGQGAQLAVAVDAGAGAGVGLEAGSGAGEKSIALLLQGGVRLATTSLALALASSFFFDLPLGNTSVPFRELFDGSQGWIRLLAQFGLLTLAATPLLRVALAALVFTRSGERGQATVAAAVLGLLLIAMFLGTGSAG